jgi:hydroxymethylglutaryl-CoA lyase
MTHATWAGTSRSRRREPGAAVSVAVVEVSPRDGLQDEPTVLPTATKVSLIGQAMDAGVRRIEAVSFARPERVPTMADAEAVLAGVDRRPGVRLAGLVLNERGLERALAAGVDEINVVVLVSETFSRRNQGLGLEEALRMWSRVAARAAGAHVGATVTLSAAFGCPYEGWMDPARVREMARRAAEDGPIEIALADTIGCAVPPEVDALVRGVAADTGLPVRVHLPLPPARRPSMPASAASAGAPSPRGRPATSPPKTWCTCSTAWTSRPG